MEKLLESIPAFMLRKSKDKDGNEIIVKNGLRIKYFPKMDIWQCGYTFYLPKSEDKYKNVVGSGYSILEAVDDFVNDKFYNYKKLNKIK